MTGILAAIAVLLIGVIPSWLKPSWVIAMLAVATGIFCIAGLLWRWLGGTLTGCVVAVINLALALWWSGSALNVLSAVTFGLAQLFLLETTHFAGRFAGAEVDRSVWRAQMAWWIMRTALCFLAAILLLLIASCLTLVMAPFGRPMISAVGALLAFAATIAVVLSLKEGSS